MRSMNTAAILVSSLRGGGTLTSADAITARGRKLTSTEEADPGAMRSREAISRTDGRQFSPMNQSSASEPKPTPIETTMAEQPIPATFGVDHVGLTVRDLESIRGFFCDCLGWRVVGERPDHPAAFVSDGHDMITKAPTQVDSSRQLALSVEDGAMAPASASVTRNIPKHVADRAAGKRERAQFRDLGRSVPFQE